MLKKLTLAAVALVLGSAGASAHTTLEATEAPRRGEPQSRLPRAPWLRRQAHQRGPRPDSGRGHRRETDAGWTLEKVSGAYANAYDYHGTPTKEGVKEVLWKDGNMADDEYDEFVVRVYLTPGLPVGKMLYFPIVQECPAGAVERWIEIPAEGQSSDALEFPAPGIKLLEKKSGH